MPHPPCVTFGSASLLVGGNPLAGPRSVAVARALLEAAVAAGATRLDTAPSYGHGRAEELVIEVAAAQGVPVTTKVGLEAVPPPPAARRAAGRVLRALPTPLERAGRHLAGQRTAPAASHHAASGRFVVAAVRTSVERSLRRAARRGGQGRLDRLLLHEVWPGDVTDELLGLLGGYLTAGDVGELGVATQNHLTTACLARGPGLLTVAQVDASLSGPGVPAVPEDVHVVGHGLLGAGGRDLQVLRRAARRGTLGRTEDDLGAGDEALVRALAHLAAQGLAEVVVATRRVARVAALVGAPAAAPPHLSTVPQVREALHHTPPSDPDMTEILQTSPATAGNASRARRRGRL